MALVCAEKMSPAQPYTLVSRERTSQKKNRLFSINPLRFRNLGESRSIHPWLHYVTIKSEKVWWLHQPPIDSGPLYIHRIANALSVLAAKFHRAPIQQLLLDVAARFPFRPNMDTCVSSSACATLCVCALYMPCDCSGQTSISFQGINSVSFNF